MIIIDFIDMLSRADKIAIMEELELAVETDKAKPQVGQLSDLGLVEMTRHRQGQSLAEIFTKKCPHCNGTGHILEDFGFASSLSEGENRSKAAKLKLPMNGKNKHNDKNNKVFNYQHNAPKNDYDRRNHNNEEQNSPDNQQQNEEQARQENKNRRFNKNKKNNRYKKDDNNNQQPVIAEDTEISVPVENIVQEPAADIKPAESQSDEQAAVVKDEKTQKTARKRTSRKSKKAAEDNNIEQSVQETIQPVSEEQQPEQAAPVKKTKTRKASRSRKKTTEKTES